MTQVAPHSGRRARREAEKHPVAPQYAQYTSPSAAGAAPTPSSSGDPGYASAGMLLQEDREPPRGRHATTHGQNFPRVIGWTVLGSLIPGVGLIAAGRRGLGACVLFVTAVLVSAAATYAVIGDPITAVLDMIATPDDFVVIAAVLVALVVLWAVIVVGTHASLRRYAHLGTGQRMACALLVTALIGLVAVPTAKAGSYALITRDVITQLFKNSPAPKTPTGGQPDTSGAAADPWAGTERINVLLIGSDAGADRTGIRPDTMIVASINTQTGDTVLFSLPRNLQRVPFPPGTQQAADNPYGFYCINPTNGVNTECLLNALWTFGEQNWKRYYAKEPTQFDAGLRATEDGIEQATGLPIDQYAMLNLRGFMQFVDAVGGITVNVKERLPIGGDAEHHVATGWIEPGDHQLLDGYHALWYARSRWSTSDYSRMQRQRCAIGAVVAQADPAKVAVAFPAIAAAAKNNITTDIPLRDVKAWVELSLKVKKAHVRSLPFTDAVIDTANPDFLKMRDLVQAAIAAPSAEASPTPSTSASTAGTTGTKKPSNKPSSTPVDSSKAQDVSQACA